MFILLLMWIYFFLVDSFVFFTVYGLSGTGIHYQYSTIPVHSRQKITDSFDLHKNDNSAI